MIMASCTTESQAEESFSHGIDLFIDDVHFHFLLINFCKHLGTKSKVPCRNQVSMFFRIGLIRKQIACNLLANKLVVGDIFIKRFDNIIAVAPSVSMRNIFIQSVGICIACNIKPMAAPAFAISGRGQITVDHVLVGIGRIIRKVECTFRKRGGQSSQIKTHPPNEGTLIRLLRGCDACSFQLRKNEGINGITNPRTIFDLRNAMLFNGLERPMLCSTPDNFIRFRVDSALLDPKFKVANFSC